MPVPGKSRATGQLLHRPLIVLMDEATVGLDPDARLQLFQDVRKRAIESNAAVL
jgi:ABC-type multidrug transport system ATPase subunit